MTSGADFHDVSYHSGDGYNSTPQRPVTFDGSHGAVNFDDVLALLFAWGACPRCPADLDQSGAVDFDDVLIVLQHWGPCP